MLQSKIGLDRDVAIITYVSCCVDVFQHLNRAVCCSVLQRIAVRCSVFKSKMGLDRDVAIIILVSCRVNVYLHLHRAVCCRVLQCVAVCCSVCYNEKLAWTVISPSLFLSPVVLTCFSIYIEKLCCRVMQCVAVCCSVLQSDAVCGSVLQ